MVEMVSCESFLGWDIFSVGGLGRHVTYLDH